MSSRPSHPRLPGVINEPQPFSYLTAFMVVARVADCQSAHCRVRPENRGRQRAHTESSYGGVLLETVALVFRMVRWAGRLYARTQSHAVTSCDGGPRHLDGDYRRSRLGAPDGTARRLGMRWQMERAFETRQKREPLLALVGRHVAAVLFEYQQAPTSVASPMLRRSTFGASLRGPSIQTLAAAPPSYRQRRRLPCPLSWMPGCAAWIQRRRKRAKTTRPMAG